MTDYLITNCTVTNCNIYSTDSTTRYDIAPSGSYDTETCTATGMTYNNDALMVSSAVVGNGIQGNKLTVTPINSGSSVGKGASVYADSNNAVHCATVAYTLNGSSTPSTATIDSLDEMPTDDIGQYTSVTVTFQNPTKTTSSISLNSYVVTPERGALYYKRNGKWEKEMAV